MSGERPDLSGYAAGSSSSRRPVPVSDDERDPVDPVRPPTTTKPTKRLRASVPDAAATDEVTLQFNTRLSRRHRAMLTELVAQHPYGRLATMRLVLEEAIDALAAARRQDPRAGVDVGTDDDVAVQFNTRLSQSHRATLGDLVGQHPLGRLATLRMVTEEAITALYAERLGGERMT